MFFVKIRVSARLPGASVLYGGGVPDAPGTLLHPLHFSCSFVKFLRQS